MAVIFADRGKIGVEEGPELVSTDEPLEGVNDGNLEGAVSGT